MLSLCQILFRTIRYISNGRCRSQCCSNCIRIGFQCSRNSIVSIQRITIVGFAICFCCYSQRQRVIDCDLITIFGNRNLLGRIVGIHRQILFLIGSHRLCSIFRADHFIGSYIIRHFGSGSLKIMMHDDRCFVLLEVCIIRMRFIESIAVL